MRLRRIKPLGRAVVYHCMSRVVGGKFLMGDLEKECFRKIMWKQAAFCGVEILGYCIMSNHFHILLRVPAQAGVSDETLLTRMGSFYGKRHAFLVEAQRQIKDRGSLDPAFRQRFVSRMGDLSVFCKELKQRFSSWYNRVNDRFGTFWAERFRSVIVEDTPSVLRILSAYIDLNPVRGGIVDDPIEYRFCGLAEAVKGDRSMRRAIGRMFLSEPWKRTVQRYRCFLLNKKGPSDGTARTKLLSSEVRQKLKNRAELSLKELLLLKIRYFYDGVFLGSSNFVDRLFKQFRAEFGPMRASGARPMKPVCRPLELYSLRDLRKDVLS